MEKFLLEKYGEEKGKKIYFLQNERLKELISNIKNQRKTLRKVILPKIALYQVLQENFVSKEEAYNTIEDYIINISEKMKKYCLKMDKTPFFEVLFKKIFCAVTLKNDNWEVELKEYTPKSFTIIIKKCLWYDACCENNCSELCKIFCRSDNITYGCLKKVRFVREGSIVLGKKECDFTFINTK